MAKTLRIEQSYEVLPTYYLLFPVVYFCSAFHSAFLRSGFHSHPMVHVLLYEALAVCHYSIMHIVYWFIAVYTECDFQWESIACFGRKIYHLWSSTRANIARGCGLEANIALSFTSCYISLCDRLVSRFIIVVLVMYLWLLDCIFVARGVA